MNTPFWIKAGSYAINGECVLWINAEATWMGDPEPLIPKPEGEAPDGPVLRTGVEVFLFGHERPPLQFPDGSPEAEDLRRFVRSRSS